MKSLDDSVELCTQELTFNPSFYPSLVRMPMGYASPPLLTEVFAYDFYRLAPAGVTLALTSLAILDRSKDEVDRSYEISMRAARVCWRRTRLAPPPSVFA